MIPNRIYPGFSRRTADSTRVACSPFNPGNPRVGWDDPMLAVRWGRVRALRQAIAHGRYDLDARLDELLDDPPAALAALTLDRA